MYGVVSTQRFSVNRAMAGVSSFKSGGAGVFPLPYQNGKVANIKKTTIPVMIFQPL